LSIKLFPPWLPPTVYISLINVGFMISLSKRSPFINMSMCLTQVISHTAGTVITWPNDEERQEIKNFFQMKGFSNVIGAIDGSHIRIDKPSSDPDSYYNNNYIHVCKNLKLYFSVFIIFLTEF